MAANHPLNSIHACAPYSSQQEVDSVSLPLWLALTNKMQQSSIWWMTGLDCKSHCCCICSLGSQPSSKEAEARLLTEWWETFWSGLAFPTPGDLPDPGIEPGSLVSPELASGFFTTEPPGKPNQVGPSNPWQGRWLPQMGRQEEFWAHLFQDSLCLLYGGVRRD